MKKSWLTIIVFGSLMAILALVLHLFEYKYFIGSLSTDVYTSAVAILFTGLGLWLGYHLINRKKQTQVKTKPSKEIADELDLNNREFEILQLIAQGHTNQEIADKLFLALPTIKTHISNLYLKLDVQSRTQAIHKAQTLELL